MRYRCRLCGQETLVEGDEYPDHPCPDCGAIETQTPGPDPWTWEPEGA